MDEAYKKFHYTIKSSNFSFQGCQDCGVVCAFEVDAKFSCAFKDTEAAASRLMYDLGERDHVVDECRKMISALEEGKSLSLRPTFQRLWGFVKHQMCKSDLDELPFVFKTKVLF